MSSGLREVPELRASVSVREPAALLSEVVGDVRRETGAHVRIDESLANDKATVLVRSRPAWEILDKLAKTFRLEWVQEGQFWVLRRSPHQAQIEAALKRRQEDDAAKRVRDRIFAMKRYLSLSIPEAETRLHEAEKGQGKDFVEVYWNVLKKFPGLGDATSDLNRVVAWALMDASPEEWRRIGQGGTWIGTYPQAPGTYPLSKGVRDLFRSAEFRQDGKFEKTAPTRFVLTLKLDYNQEVQARWTLANEDTVEYSRVGGGALTPYLFDWPLQKYPDVLKLKAWGTPTEQLGKTFAAYKKEWHVYQPWNPAPDPWMAAFDAGGPNVIASWFRIDDWPTEGLDLPNLVSHGYVRYEDSYLLALQHEYWLCGAVEFDEQLARSLENEMRRKGTVDLGRVLSCAASLPPQQANAYDSYLYYRNLDGRWSSSALSEVAYYAPIARLYASMSEEQKRKAGEEGLSYRELTQVQKAQVGCLLMEDFAGSAEEIYGEDGPLVADSKQWEKLSISIQRTSEDQVFAKLASYMIGFDREETARAWLKYQKIDPTSALFQGCQRSWIFRIGINPRQGFRRIIRWSTDLKLLESNPSKMP